MLIDLRHLHARQAAADLGQGSDGGMDAQQVAALAVQLADVGVLGAADQQLLLGALDHAFEACRRRHVAVDQQVQQFRGHVVAAALEQVGRGLQPFAQGAVGGRGAAPHRHQHAVADQELGFAEHRPVALDLDSGRRPKPPRRHAARPRPERSGSLHCLPVRIPGRDAPGHL
ncbi:Uncharacterised protein [Bordetella pertussis]|nr:Uncharacterised protein [Bordetella pertussis]